MTTTQTILAACVMVHLESNPNVTDNNRHALTALAVAAINAVNSGDFDKLLLLPNGREHMRTIDIVEALNLDAFLDMFANGPVLPDFIGALNI